MTAGRTMLSLFNRLVEPLHLRLDSTTAERQELARLRALGQSGHFGRALFPVPAAFDSTASEAILREVDSYRDRFEDFTDASRNDVGYTLGNNYYTSPDAEVLYAMTRLHRPATIVEIGSGNSTRIARQAIRDGGLQTRLISVDPRPRIDVDPMVDEGIRAPVESLAPERIAGRIGLGDFLFIDSSHAIKPGNDVVYLYLNILPALPAGAIIHVHDVFLPYEYPAAWLVERQWGWNEQYLVQALIGDHGPYEVLWAGHYLQRTRPDFAAHFPHLGGRVAQSLWLRKRSTP